MEKTKAKKVFTQSLVVTSVDRCYFGMAASKIKKIGKFKLAGMLNLKLTKKPVTPEAIAFVDATNQDLH